MVTRTTTTVTKNEATYQEIADLIKSGKKLELEFKKDNFKLDSDGEPMQTPIGVIKDGNSVITLSVREIIELVNYQNKVR